MAGPGQPGCPRRGSQVLACPLDADLVLCGPGGAQGYLLNATAAEIWALCDGAHDPPAIAARLAAAHGLDAGRALEDVVDCLRALAEAGLLESVPSAAG